MTSVRPDWLCDHVDHRLPDIVTLRLLLRRHLQIRYTRPALLLFRDSLSTSVPILITFSTPRFCMEVPAFLWLSSCSARAPYEVESGRGSCNVSLVFGGVLGILLNKIWKLSTQRQVTLRHQTSLSNRKHTCKSHKLLQNVFNEWQ